MAISPIGTVGAPAAPALRFPPQLPQGQSLDLPGRGTTWVRIAPGPAGAPTVLLLHGWLATADLNWWMAYAALSSRYRVVAVDHRAHGRGITSTAPFLLSDCAGDAAAVLRALDIDRAVIVGYSMGGAIAQLTWRLHPDVVQGLVLCATSSYFPSGIRERLAYGAFFHGAAATPAPLRRRAVQRLLGSSLPVRGGYVDWVLDEVRTHRILHLAEAGRELGRFDARPWIGGVDVPAASVITTQDQLVPTSRQRGLAAAARADVHEIAGDHYVCAKRRAAFVSVLLDAIDGVARRSA